MDDDSKATGGTSKMLTEKQAAVLDLLALGLTSKEIGFQLGLSESAVNRHIEILRSRYGDITRKHLARLYRERPDEFPRNSAEKTCVESTEQIISLVEPPPADKGQPQDSRQADLAFQDSFALRADAPWAGKEEPKVVPRVLDGKNATLTRGAAIAIILLAILVSLVLGIALAKGIAEMVN